MKKDTSQTVAVRIELSYGRNGKTGRMGRGNNIFS